MSTQPLLIDNIAFAKRNDHLAGVLSLADCARLSELLKSQAQDNVIEYSLEGETNSVGQHFLHLSLRSNLTTFCQRCLEAMPLKLDLNFHYLIGGVDFDHSEMGDVEDSDDFDLQEASQTMDLIALIEDEIIMAMPIAPAHESGCAAAVMQSGKKPNPFAVLKDLIKS